MKQNYNNKRYIISADIGGSHITTAIVDLTDKKIIEHTRTRLSVDSNGTKTEILESWTSALRTAVECFKAPVERIAMAIPGPFDYKNGISLITGVHKYEAIYGLNIKEYLSTELNIDSGNILLRNDAEAFLHGEVVAGAGLGFKKVIGITLGTGLGSAKSIDGITMDVSRGISKFGGSIADDYMSTRWFIKRYHELTKRSIANVKELTRIAVDNMEARLVFKEFTNNLVLFLKDFILAEKPELLIIGGNITKASELFLPSLQLQLDQYVAIKIAELGEDSAIVGAAAIFENTLQIK